MDIGKKTLTVGKEGHIDGTIERVYFDDEDTGYKILEVSYGVPLKTAVIKGTCCTAVEGMPISASGPVSKDSIRENYIINATAITTKDPISPDGIRIFLATVDGITENIANKIFMKWGKESLHIVDDDAAKLILISGVTEKRIERIKKSLADHKKIRELELFLAEHNIPSKHAKNIFAKYKNHSVEIIERNPYILARDIRGVGFKEADMIASKMGIEKTSVERIIAGGRHTLLELSVRNGSTIMEANSFVSNVAWLLGLNDNLVTNGLKVGIDNNEFAHIKVNGTGVIQLPEIYTYEDKIARGVKRLLSRTPTISDEELSDFNDDVETIESETGKTLSDSQRDALKIAYFNKLCIITGGPGVGKTTILEFLLELFDMNNIGSLNLCAPTGKAAKRMKEATSRDAETIHRLLKYNPSEGFSFNKHNKIETDAIVADEWSMVDTMLGGSLFDAINDDCRLIIVGDVDQIPSVGHGEVLNDLICSGVVPVARLTEVRRQAKDSNIITNAHKVNTGLPIVAESDINIDSDFYFIEINNEESIADYICDLVENSETILGANNKEIQVLASMKKGPAGINNLNARLQRIVNPNPVNLIKSNGVEYGDGDVIMQTKNDRDIGVFNGDTGVISEVRDKEIIISIDDDQFIYDKSDMNNLTPANALTIHKSQGSEYNYVIMPLARSHEILLKRKLLYTGITRAKIKCILVGNKDTLSNAIKNKGYRPRATGLVDKLKELVDPQ